MPDRITIAPATCHGKPVVAGTRTPVAVILGALAAGDTFAEVEQDYGVTSDDIRACLAFASEELGRHDYYPLSA